MTIKRRDAESLLLFSGSNERAVGGEKFVIFVFAIFRVFFILSGGGTLWNYLA